MQNQTTQPLLSFQAMAALRKVNNGKHAGRLCTSRLVGNPGRLVTQRSDELTVRHCPGSRLGVCHPKANTPGCNS